MPAYEDRLADLLSACRGIPARTRAKKKEGKRALSFGGYRYLFRTCILFSTLQ